MKTIPARKFSSHQLNSNKFRGNIITCQTTSILLIYNYDRSWYIVSLWIRQPTITITYSHIIYMYTLYYRIRNSNTPRGQMTNYKLRVPLERTLLHASVHMSVCFTDMGNPNGHYNQYSCALSCPPFCSVLRPHTTPNPPHTGYLVTAFSIRNSDCAKLKINDDVTAG